MLGFRVPTTSVGARGDGVRGVRRVRGSEEEQGSKGSEGFVILGFWVLTTCDDRKL